MVMQYCLLLVPLFLLFRYSSGRACAQMHQSLMGSLRWLGGLGRREMRGEKG